MLTKSGRGPPFEMERYVSLDFQRYLENHMTRLNTIFGNWKQQFSHWPLATAILCAAVLSFPLAPAVKHTAGIQGPQSILTAKMGTVLCSVPKKKALVYNSSFLDLLWNRRYLKPLIHINIYFTVFDPKEQQEITASWVIFLPPTWSSHYPRWNPWVSAWAVPDQ